MLEKEYRYYKKHKEELTDKYLGKHIVIKDDKVVGVYNSLEEAMLNSLQKYQLGTFFVKQIEKEEQVLCFYNKAFA